MIAQSDRIKDTIEQWCDKGCIDTHTELLCRTNHAIVKELERTNLLLLELLNRTVKDDK